jgi:hypothetical protein
VSRGFPPGAYTLMARLIIGGRVLASSPPTYVVIGRH